MKVNSTWIYGLFFLTPNVFVDERGLFMESYSKKVFDNLEIKKDFVQDNHSISKRNVIRGLHCQFSKEGQGKLVRCVRGKILDVAVDIRPCSHTYLKHFKIVLSEENKTQLYVPPFFLHGFRVMSDEAEVLYKCSSYYSPAEEKTFRYDSHELNIDWGLEENPILSEKDKLAPIFNSLKHVLKVSF